MATILDLSQVANQKRKVSHADFLDCYNYFNRAIQTGRLLKESENPEIYEQAKQDFSKIPPEIINETSITSLQDWIDQYIDNRTWSRCYRALNQKKYLEENNHRTITISDEAYNALKDFANQKNISLSQAIIDGCAFIKDSDESLVAPATNSLEHNTITPADLSPTQKKLSSKPPTPAAHKKTNVISLFGDEEIGSLDEDMEPESDSFYFDEIPVWPSKPEGYDFRTNESYKEYRKHIERLTIKKPDENLLDYFSKTINYYLKEDNCHQIGQQLLAIRQELLNQKLFSQEFNPDNFAISKGFSVTNMTMDDYADELIYLLGFIFGCTTQSITAGNREPMVFAGHPNHVQIAYKTYNYLDAFLKDEVKWFAERCHKNTKRKNRRLKAKWHGCHLVGTMLNNIIDDEEHYMLLPQAEYEKLSQYAFKKVHVYYDENEPIGGWYSEKKDKFW